MMIMQFPRTTAKMNDSKDRPPRILPRDDGATIAYRRLDGKSPGVMFLSGFMSDMRGTKALEIECHCKAGGHAFVRFDYRGHGESSGDFVDGTIGAWVDDAVAVLDECTDGPQVLVGSSMGASACLQHARRARAFDACAGIRRWSCRSGGPRTFLTS